MHALPRSIPVVIPIAAVEQHGHHLPVYTDSYLLGEVVRRAEAAAPELALFAPVQWLGNSHHHMDYPGTLSAEPRLYLDLLLGLAQNMLDHGFTRLLFLNGHGGNITPLKQALFELRQKHRTRNDMLLLAAPYWEMATPAAGRPEFVQKDMGHACEWETSMILALAPHLVAPGYAELQSVPNGYGFEPAYRAWITKERTPTGHIGDPQLATAAKGELLFTEFSAGVVTFLQRMQAWDGAGWPETVPER